MSIRVALQHVTDYRYDRPVSLQPQIVRLRPAPHCRTPILSYSLRIEPEPHFLNWQQDPYSNYLARLVFPESASHLRVEVDLVAELSAFNPFDFFIVPEAERFPFHYEASLARELVPYLEIEPAGPQMQELLLWVQRSNCNTVDYLVDLNRHIQEEIHYVIRMEPGVQPCEETLTKRSGSCRDSAWLLVQVLRQMGLASRFVSGYLIQLVADVKPLEGPSGPDRDFTELHAWAEVYLPGAGWVGLDPTSGLLAGEGHIPLACTADPSGAAPVTGSFTFTSASDDDCCREDVKFHMSVQRIHEDPRVAKPYTAAQWADVLALGDRVEQVLRSGDVRLTMGGEPTFIAIDDRDAAEWNTDALGEAKLLRGDQMLRRLRDRFAPGGLLHFGQGKLYPGESLPRWTFGCYWRKDGVPLWENPELVADREVEYGHGPDEAKAFITRLAERLEVNPHHCLPGHEDAWYHIWRERRLPVNVDPLENQLEDAEERARLARVFEQGLGSTVGYVLPLRRRSDRFGPRWESSQWLLRAKHLFLIPGDSPMGYRLPLDSLPWEPADERDVIYQVDPFASRGPLPSRSRWQPPLILRQDGPAATSSRLGGDGLGGADGHDGADSSLDTHSDHGAHSELGNGQAKSAPGLGRRLADDPSPLFKLVRTALCVEPRDGRLHVFMPPVEAIEDYIELVAAIEATAEELHLPVMVEGYSPPFDYRVNLLQVSPDPGVLEVNVHPSSNWRDLVALTEGVYEEARLSRLAADKFMVDGRHCGTGGGNHIVIGGPTPADSPILRRPDLLRSLLGCWHNHPAMSYVFSSLFLGPTSQAPRIDEARNDSVYELQLAFRQIPDTGHCPPWLVDRVFRHLLVDVTGNTHRAEFCIDKLYAPESSIGRRGLLELRAFEMPPHPQMSLVQQVLLRALVARFWNTPYQQRLVRWGTELHDRFMLPHFLEQDLEDLLLELSAAGFPFDKAWFAPHLEFRFPQIGAVTYRGVELELRHAIEPWHVLGEEPGGGGTVRYVDSSVERLQVRVRGLTDGRHVVLCNGRPVPLHPTGVNGEYIAGVRYRAWQPPSCLHPTIPVHTPLVFDLYDAWSERSMGGCQYHVSHVGGRAYETTPVNAIEAESRRRERFIPHGHTPGPMWPVAAAELPESAFTLDLRQSPPTPASLRARRTGTLPASGEVAISPPVGEPAWR